MIITISYVTLTLPGQIKGCAMLGLPSWYGTLLACILLNAFVVDYLDRGGQHVQHRNAASFCFKLG